MKTIWFVPLAIAGSALAQTPQAIPKFEAVSVKPCRPAGPPTADGQRGLGTPSRAASPARLFLGCLPVRVMIIQALSAYRRGGFDDDWNPRGTTLTIEGGPAWVGADHYTIEGVMSGALRHDMIYGPMLRAVLEDRFQLKTHRERREVPELALTVAKGGLKLLRPGDRSCALPEAGGPPKDDAANGIALGCEKLQPTAEGSCNPRVEGQPLPVNGKPECWLRGTFGAGRTVLDQLGRTMAEIAQSISGADGGRPIIDQTGIAGKFNLHLEFEPANAPPGEDRSGVPSLSSALADLGLKLDPTKGTRDFLVIERIERPSGN